MPIRRDMQLIHQARSAVDSLIRTYGRGAFRVIRDPEGVISLWAIEGTSQLQFSLTFVEKGRCYGRIEELSDDYLSSFVAFVRTRVR